MADATLSFASFVRRGLATSLLATEGGPGGSVSQAALSLGIESTAGEVLTANPTLTLVGPGDIVGLDPSVIVRTVPKPDDFDAEYVPYALVEMDQADLPWRYTPAMEAGVIADGTDQLRPWLSLVVVPTAEATLDAPTPEQKLAVLNAPATSLPPPGDLWAFAHTQFSGSGLGDTAIKEQLAGPRGQFVARIMSSRLLQQNTEYYACLVPTFERGRLAGLGKDPADVDGLAAWDTSGGGVIQLPVYFSWRFATSTAGSFEQLARLIEPAVFPATLGRRDMDVSDAGLGLDPAAPNAVPTNSLPAEGALMSVAAAEAPAPVWPSADRQAFLTKFTKLVNAPAEADAGAGDPILVPPLYGQWYAADDELNQPQPAGTNPRWFNDLNSDPRNRVAAGLGTKVIQREEQALLASGWDQVDELRTINDMYRVLQLGRGTLQRIYKRHVSTASLQRAYFWTLRLHAFITCGDKTICGKLKSSPIVPGFMSSQWVRWTRARGPIGLVQGRQALTSPLAGIIDLLNDGRCLRPAPEPSPPGGLPTGEDPRDGLRCDQIETLIGLGSSVTLFWGLLLLWVVRKLLISQNGDCWWIALKTLRFAILLIYIANNPDDVRRRCKWRHGTLTAADIAAVPPRFSFTAALALPNPIPTPAVSNGSADNADAAAVRSALIALFNAIAPPPALTCPPPMTLPECKETIIATIEPELTVGLRLKSRVTVNVVWNPVDELEPIFAPPDYEQPMYEPLSRISGEWILPGLSTIKKDTVGLAVANQRFIEAYMTGLNHEMTRELLWNEFPTDQRGTYFRQFWDVSGHVLANGSTLPPEQLRDIKVFREWDPNAPLGGNSPRPLAGPNGDQPFLVLVVRAQLIQKYPNVIVYAQKTQDGTGGGKTLIGEQRHPVFYALLKPDTAFYGFDLTADEIREDESWYFVLQEQPGEPKFAEEGANLATQTFTTPSNFFIRDDETNDPVATFATSAAHFAHETFLLPFRLGIQGTAMLPQEP